MPAMTPCTTGSVRAVTRLALIAAAAVALSACEGMKEQLGLAKKSPDEFTVVAAAPLVLPPDYALRPPNPGAPRPYEVQPRDRAQAALTRQAENQAPAARSQGEAALLSKAGAVNPDPNIRRTINEEFTQLAERDKGFIDRLVFWQKSQAPGQVVDATEEARRLREAAAQNQPPTTGDTPVIQRRKRGILEGVF